MSAVEQAHARYLLTLASSLGVQTCARPLRWSLDVCAHVLGLVRVADPRPRVTPMSDAWLRQHEKESGKHAAGH